MDISLFLPIRGISLSSVGDEQESARPQVGTSCGTVGDLGATRPVSPEQEDQ